MFLNFLCAFPNPSYNQRIGSRSSIWMSAPNKRKCVTFVTDRGYGTPMIRQSQAKTIDAFQSPLTRLGRGGALKERVLVVVLRGRHRPRRGGGGVVDGWGRL